MTQNFQNKIDSFAIPSNSFTDNSNKKLQLNQIARFENENYLLRQELEDLKTKYINLKKQQQIWEQINTHHGFSNMSEKRQCCRNETMELSKMKEQFVIIVKQKQQLDYIIQQQRQKIQDLKYHNNQLRLLNQKQQRIHQKQIQLFSHQQSNKIVNTSNNINNNSSKKSFTQFPSNTICDNSFDSSVYNYYERQNNGLNAGYHPSYNNSNNSSNKLAVAIKQLERKLSQKQVKIEILQQQVRKQKQTNIKNQQKLQKCSEISRQMQQYYTNQLQQKQQLVEQQQVLIKNLQSQISQIQKQNNFIFQSPLRSAVNHHEQNNDSTSLKCSSVISQYHHQNSFQYGNNLAEMEQKYQKLLLELKVNYEKQLSKYQEKIRYLLLKVESLEAEKKYWQNQSSEILGADSSVKKDFDLRKCQNINSNSIQHHNNKNILLKMSKVSSNNGDTFSTNQNSFSLISPKQNFSRGHLNEQEQKSMRKLTSISKTPNTKSLHKYAGNVRNSCHYQRAPLGESRGNNIDY